MQNQPDVCSDSVIKKGRESMELFNQLGNVIVGLFQSSGLCTLSWENYVMIVISFLLMFLAIKKQYEPLLLLPIAFGMMIVNIFPAIMANPTTQLLTLEQVTAKGLDPASYPTTTQLMTQAQAVAAGFNPAGMERVLSDGAELYKAVYYNVSENGGLFYYLYQGVHLGIFPPLIFLGIGAMTDFGPLIANPKSFILGAAAQIGIFITFIGIVLFNHVEKTFMDTV